MVKFYCMLILAVLYAWGGDNQDQAVQTSLIRMTSQHVQTEEPVQLPLPEVDMPALLGEYIGKEFSFYSLHRNLMWRVAGGF